MSSDQLLQHISSQFKKYKGVTTTQTLTLTLSHREYVSPLPIQQVANVLQAIFRHY